MKHFTITLSNTFSDRPGKAQWHCWGLEMPMTIWWAPIWSPNSVFKKSCMDMWAHGITAWRDSQCGSKLRKNDNGNVKVCMIWICVTLFSYPFRGHSISPSGQVGLSAFTHWKLLHRDYQLQRVLVTGKQAICCLFSFLHSVKHSD